MKNLLSSLSFFALMLSGLSAVSQESVMLKYGMKEGDRFLQNMEITQNTMQSVMGQEVKVLGEISGSATCWWRPLLRKGIPLRC